MEVQGEGEVFLWPEGQEKRVSKPALVFKPCKDMDLP